MGARLYSPPLGRFLQIDPMPGGNASPYDYCTGDPVNCTDLDGNWGMPKWLKKTVQVIAVVAEIASNIPGPIGAVAAAVSSVSYAATGNWAKAAEMAVTAVAATVGAGPVVKAAAAAVKSTRAASRVSRAASKARTVFRRSGCNSFDPQTPVLMADRTYTSIIDIKVGDLVTATDPGTGETSAQPVIAVFTTYTTKHMVDISTSLDASGLSLRATAYHPIWVVGKGWTDAGDIQPGEFLLGPGGQEQQVTSVLDEGEVADQLVVNLNVGNVHTFTVSDEAGGDIIAHNNTEVCPIHGPVKRPWQLSPSKNRRTEKQGGHTYVEQAPDRKGNTYWWSRDTAGHASIAFKVMKKVKNTFVWHTDACVCGTYATKKHKGKIGKVVRRR